MRVVRARTGPVHQAPSTSRPMAEVLIDQDVGGEVPETLDPAGNSQWLSAGPLDQLADDTAVHSRFDLTTGAPAGPPATRPVPVYPVRITAGGGIEVALPARSGGAAHG